MLLDFLAYPTSVLFLIIARILPHDHDNVIKNSMFKSVQIFVAMHTNTATMNSCRVLSWCSHRHEVWAHPNNQALDGIYYPFWSAFLKQVTTGISRCENWPNRLLTRDFSWHTSRELIINQFPLCLSIWSPRGILHSAGAEEWDQCLDLRLLGPCA